MLFLYLKNTATTSTGVQAGKHLQSRASRQALGAAVEDGVQAGNSKSWGIQEAGGLPWGLMPAGQTLLPIPLSMFSLTYKEKEVQSLWVSVLLLSSHLLSIGGVHNVSRLLCFLVPHPHFQILIWNLHLDDIGGWMSWSFIVVIQLLNWQKLALQNKKPRHPELSMGT